MTTFNVYESFATVTVSPDGATATVYVENNVRVSPTAGTYTGSYNIKINGTITDSGTSAKYISSFSGGSTVLSDSQAFTTSYTATQSVTWEVNWASSADDDGFVARTKSGTVTIPIRPPQLPSAPTSASATYVSDAQVNVAWTRPTNASSASNIWSQTEIERWKQSTGTWGRVALLTGTPTSWSDTTTSANDRYQYRVRGVNVTGGGEWETTGYVSTTPATPTGVSAAKSGDDIVVSWTDQSRAETGFEVQDETTTVGTPTASPFTHTAPSNLTAHPLPGPCGR